LLVINMRQFNSPVKNTFYLFYRLISPLFDPISLYYGVFGYPRYIKQLIQYKVQDPSNQIRFTDLYPLVKDSRSLTPFDTHYFFQGVWLLKEILKRKPLLHIDVGSMYTLSGYISLITKVEFVDIRPIDTHLENLSIIRGNILNLPYAKNSVSSISSLHVIEHIGLGRYGDEINPNGSELACKELCRVVKPGGLLYISVPIGKPRICFNAHRVFDPKTIISFCKPLKLIKFCVVDDKGLFKRNVQPEKYRDESYACGLYVFKKIR
jgi:SAM-dependent methyltransferase